LFGCNALHRPTGFGGVLLFKKGLNTLGDVDMTSNFMSVTRYKAAIGEDESLPQAASRCESLRRTNIPFWDSASVP
jgi:hypothetical protein